MSGIVGIYFFDGRLVERSHIEKMTSAISYRGPDSSGIWHEGSVGLGNCLLQTTPESLNEKLPLLSRSGDLVLVADARIDNRSELISDLKITDKQITDSKLILSAYEKWSTECPKKLIGDFAFAIWDKKQNYLFCARDVLGVRPFYYYKGDNFIAFASDPRGIFVLPFVSKELNYDGMIDYLMGFYGDSESTVFKRLHKLKFANFLLVTKKLIQCKEYWTLSHEDNLLLKNEEEYKDLFLEIFTRAVTDRLRSNQDVGILFSGGLDSSSILCLAEDLKLNNKINVNLIAYSAVFNGEKEDESKYMESVKEKYGTKILKTINKLPNPLWTLSEAMCTDAQPLVHELSNLQTLLHSASNNNCKIMLSGIGGDNFLDLHPDYISELIFQGHFIRAWNYLRNIVVFNQSILFDVSFQFVIKRILSKLSPLWVKKSYSLLKSLYDDSFISHNFYSLAYERHKRFQNKQISFGSVQSGYLSLVLEEWDRISSNELTEFRHPLCDRRLIELCFNMPKDLIVKGEKPKYFLREVIGHRFPKLIKERTNKWSYDQVINEQLGVINVEEAKKLLNFSCLERLELINGKKARVAYDSYVNKCARQEDKTNILNQQIWYLLSLESWTSKLIND